MNSNQYNLIVIISDTLRQDHLGCYGNDRIRTPNLDNFSEKSVTFNNFYTASFPTMPNRADLYTGKWTFTYLGWAPLPRHEIILPEILTNAGYTTIGITDTPFYIGYGNYYDRGFKNFLEIHGQQWKDRKYVTHGWRYEEDRFAPKTFTEAEHWLECNYDDDKPFFALVDTWDPHEPWDPPRWYTELYRPDYDGEAVPPSYSRNFNEEKMRTAHACYCGEITMVDEWVGRFLRKVENMQLMDDTIIVFTSDHGFYFGEHGIFGKGIFEKFAEIPVERRGPWTAKWLRSPLYEEAIRIPLILYHPDAEPKHIDTLHSYIDLMPTLLDLLGIEVPGTVQGYSMNKKILNDSSKGRDFVVSSLPLYNPGDMTRAVDEWERKIKEFIPSTITTRNWSLLYAAEGEDSELYNLKEDPNQRENVIEDHFDIAEELHKNFLKVLESSRVDQRLLEPRRKISLKTKKSGKNS